MFTGLNWSKTGIGLIGCAFLVVASCNRDPWKVDVSDIPATVTIDRFEADLFLADPAALENLIPVWRQKYGVFFDHYSYILNLGAVDDPAFPERLRQFVTSYTNYRAYHRTREVFPDLEEFSGMITGAFRHYRYYFPEKPVPRIITFVSGFTRQAITDDSLLAVGLDHYLGSNEPLYRQIGIYNYLLDNMQPGRLASDCMLFWGETEFPFHDSVNNLMAQMVYRGRLLFFNRAMLPDQPDSLNWGFSGQDMKYLHGAEKAMWAYLVEKKLLFNTDRFTMDKFIQEGPFTKDFGRNSPPRAALWIGYRIVESYMQHNRSVTLQALMEEKDYLRILNMSGYNP